MVGRGPLQVLTRRVGVETETAAAGAIGSYSGDPWSRVSGLENASDIKASTESAPSLNISAMPRTTLASARGQPALSDRSARSIAAQAIQRGKGGRRTLQQKIRPGDDELERRPRNHQLRRQLS